MRYVCILTLCLFFVSSTYAATYYVSLSGNNSNDGSSGRPWRTIQHALSKVPAGQGHTIKIGAGTFVENQLHVPEGVHLLGEGREATIIKANSSFYFNPASPGFSNDRFLIRLYSGGSASGNQSVKNLTVDGDGKRVHGGIFIHNRSNVVIDNVRIQYMNFNGLWFSNANNSSAKNIVLKDCAWGSASWCSSALAIAHSNNLDISNFDIDEARGYGIKNLGHDQNQPLTNVKIHHGKVSVHQTGLWNNGSAPNITIEFWASGFSGTEIYNTYVDNHISIINPNNTNSGTPLKIYNNVLDINGPRTKGSGYGIELSASNVEIRNNYFNGGYTGIVNWVAKTFSNWNVHHNIFYSISGGPNPTAVVTSYKGGLSNANFYNNTVEMTSTGQAVHFLEFDNSSRGTNVNIKNNLIINGSQGANRVVNLRNGGSVGNLNVTNNFFQNIQQGSAPGNFSANATGTAGIARSGARPQGYYNHVGGGNLIDKGVNVGYESKPDIGACGDNNIIGTAAPVSSPAPSPSPVAVTSVAVSPTALSVSVDATGTLGRTIAPSNASNQSVTWTSSNTNIARVDGNGVVTGVATGTATITVRTADGGKTATANVTVTPKTSSTAGVNGRLTRQVWTNVSGSNLSYLRAHGAFPNSPNSTSQVTSFAGPSNWGDNYGDKIYGYIRPQTSGSYTFWITSDDESELWLSTDQNASNKVLVARAPAYTNPGELTKHAQQKSSTINLVAGRYYYVEAIHKDGGGSDHLAVYWQGPGIGQSIVSSAYISTTVGSSGTTTVPVSSVAVSPTSVNVNVNSTNTLSKVVSPSNASNQSVTWTSSNTSIARVDGNGVVTGVAVGTATISAKTADGNKTGSCTVKVVATSTPTTPAPLPPVSNVPRDGRLTRMAWNNLSGEGLSVLKNFSRFPNSPDHRVTITQFDAPANWGDNYGSRIFGYIVPPVSGSYTFWISGDANCELYLSTDRFPQNKRLIASVPGSTAKGELGKYSQQKSVSINLVANTYYNIEALHKESTGGDHVSVYWQGPGISQQIIGANYISTTASSGGGGGMPTLAEEEISSNFVVYPVPVERGNDFVVEVPAESTEVRVIDLNGRQHRRVAVTNERKVFISSEGLDAGLYYMQVMNPYGSAFKKVMVK